MKTVIVPDSLRDTINTKLDKAILDCPEAEKDREILYNQLLSYFDRFGEIPDFSLVKKD